MTLRFSLSPDIGMSFTRPDIPRSRAAPQPEATSTLLLFPSALAKVVCHVGKTYLCLLFTPTASCCLFLPGSPVALSLAMYPTALSHPTASSPPGTVTPFLSALSRCSFLNVPVDIQNSMYMAQSHGFQLWPPSLSIFFDAIIYLILGMTEQACALQKAQRRKVTDPLRGTNSLGRIKDPSWDVVT